MTNLRRSGARRSGQIPRTDRQLLGKCASVFTVALLPLLLQGCSSWIAAQPRECREAPREDWAFIGVGWRKDNSPLFILDPQSTEAPRLMWTGVPHLNSLAWSPDGRLYSVGGEEDDLLVVLDPRNGEVKAKRKLSFRGPSLAHGGRLDVRALAVNKAGELYAAATDGYSDAQSILYRINPATGDAFLVGSLNTAGVIGLDFGPDGALYGWAAGGRSERGTGLVRIDARTARVRDMNFWKGGGPEIQSLAFTPDCQLFGGGDHIVRIGRDHRQTLAVAGSRLRFLDAPEGNGGVPIRGLAVIPRSAGNQHPTGALR